MERVDYPTIIQSVPNTYVSDDSKDRDIETHAIYDTDRDRYQILQVGWRESDRTFACTAYLAIKNDKIWIHRDLTEMGIANELLDAGVPKSAIVLAFHAPYTRQYTDFATG